MIDLYSWVTPNGEKAHIMLEEAGIPYKAHAIDIGAGDQFKRSFRKISPNGRIPAIIDRQGPSRKPYSLFETGAILIYLAEKSGKFMPKRTAARFDAIQWVMWQMANIGPIMGQAYHFRKYAAGKSRYAANRFTKETNRLYHVADKQLSKNEYLAGAYSIADMACWPWMRLYKGAGVNIDDYPNVKRWHEAIKKRPGVRRGMEVLGQYRKKSEAPMTAKEREILYGKTQYKRR
jgi:GST-like protein